MSVKAERRGLVAWFPDGVWASGAPERTGWVRLGKTQTENVIPKEVIDFSEKQAAEVKKKDVRAAVRKIGTEPVETPEEISPDIKAVKEKKPRKPKK